MTPGNTKPSAPRAVRMLACVVTVPILLVCAELVRALPGLDPQGQGRADGEVIWPISAGAVAVVLWAGVLRAPRGAAGCLLAPLVIVGGLCTVLLVGMLSEG